MIEVKNLHKSFGSLEVLKGIDCYIEEKEVLCVIGPSGSGKSTFLRCLNMLEKLTSGDVIIDGENLADPANDINKLRAEIGMVFQQFNLFPHKSVLDNIILAPQKVRNLSNTEAKERALTLLEKVRKSDKADMYPDQLSGGRDTYRLYRFILLFLIMLMHVLSLKPICIPTNYQVVSNNVSLSQEH